MSAYNKWRFQIVIIVALLAISQPFRVRETWAGSPTLTFGHYASEDHIMGQTAVQFLKIFESRGSARIKYYPDSKLGSSQQMFEMTRTGQIDMTLAPISYLWSIAPEMDILKLPFLFENHDDVDRILNSEGRIGRALLDGMESRELKGLAFWEIGFRHLTTSRRSVHDLWDIKGLKIRTNSSPFAYAFKLLGANPVQMPLSELRSALKRGVLNAQEETIDTIYRQKLYQMQKHLSLTRHGYTALVLIIHKNSFNKLSIRDQEHLASAAREATVAGRRLAREMEAKHIYDIRDRGVRVVSNPDWGYAREKIFYQVQERYVREGGRRILDMILSSKY